MIPESGRTLCGMAEWPEVRVDGGDLPRAVDHGLDEGLEIVLPRQVIAYGTVNDLPWTIQSYVTSPGPDAKWWEHGSVGPELEFFLGKDGHFGGGGVGTRLNEGTHFTASVGFFGRFPEVVSWVGVVSDLVDHLDVRLDDGQVRRVDVLEPTLDSFPRFFWFFPPRGAAGVVVALGADGRELQREDLIHLEVEPDANAVTSVNAFGYPADRPPPGWPEDPTPYAPGEGPRWSEDFCLHVARFPLYVVPPELWGGFAGLSGSGSSGPGRVTEVGVGYFEDVGGGSRGFEVINRDPRESDRRSRFARQVRPEDVGIWWNDPYPADDVANFVARFRPREDRRVRSPIWNVGPRRYLDGEQVMIAGVSRAAERWEFMDYPSLRLLRVPLPEVEITLQGWEFLEDELLEFAGALEPMRLGSDLFRRMSEAQKASDAAARRLHEI